MVPLFVALLALTTVSAAEDLNPLSDAVIDFINSQQDSWTAGRNFPEDTPLELLRKLNGVIHNASRKALPVIQHDILDMDNAVPLNFDPREKWPFCPSLSEIRNQGACGSCWAFGAVEVMTDRYCITSNGKQQFHFSAEDPLACSRYDGCQGGEPANAWSYLIGKGIVSGGNFHSQLGCLPYRLPPPCLLPGVPKYCTEEKDVPTPACLYTCREGYNVEYSQDKKFGERTYMLLNDEITIISELILNGPVQASFEVFEDFTTYRKGVYIRTWGKFLGGHSVKILGYGVENGTKYWLAANSWGDTWGDLGFFKIRRGVNECGIENEVICGQLKV